jgi:hypothetical protein
MTSGRRSLLWFVWIAPVVLTRLPEPLRPDLVPEPDEAVLGLMEKLHGERRFHIPPELDSFLVMETQLDPSSSGFTVRVRTVLERTGG